MASSDLPGVREVAIARQELEQDLDETTLLPIFLSRVPERMQAAIDMIVEGCITSEHFFHDHPFRTVFDPTTSEQIPQTVSLLEDLIDINRSSLPDLSPFAEGQFRKSRPPEEQLLKDFGVIDTVLSACRGKEVDPRVRQSATDPGLIAKSWSTFAHRLAALQQRRCSPLVGATFLRGLDELEGLPPSRARVASASNLACVVHMLDIGGQYKAFKRTVQIILSEPDTVLICKAASSLEHLAPRWVPSCASYLMKNARTEHAFHALPEAIGKVMGKTGRDIEKWYDRASLALELRRLIRARSQSSLTGLTYS